MDFSDSIQIKKADEYINENGINKQITEDSSMVKPNQEYYREYEKSRVIGKKDDDINNEFAASEQRLLDKKISAENVSAYAVLSNLSTLAKSALIQCQKDTKSKSASFMKMEKSIEEFNSALDELRNQLTDDSGDVSNIKAITVVLDTIAGNLMEASNEYILSHSGMFSANRMNGKQRLQMAKDLHSEMKGIVGKQLAYIYQNPLSFRKEKARGEGNSGLKNNGRMEEADSIKSLLFIELRNAEIFGVDVDNVKELLQSANSRDEGFVLKLKRTVEGLLSNPVKKEAANSVRYIADELFRYYAVADAGVLNKLNLMLAEKNQLKATEEAVLAKSYDTLAEHVPETNMYGLSAERLLALKNELQEAGGNCNALNMLFVQLTTEKQYDGRQMGMLMNVARKELFGILDDKKASKKEKTAVRKILKAQEAFLLDERCDVGLRCCYFEGNIADLDENTGFSRKENLDFVSHFLNDCIYKETIEAHRETIDDDSFVIKPDALKIIMPMLSVYSDENDSIARRNLIKYFGDKGGTGFVQYRDKMASMGHTVFNPTGMELNRAVNYQKGTNLNSQGKYCSKYDEKMHKYNKKLFEAMESQSFEDRKLVVEATIEPLLNFKWPQHFDIDYIINNYSELLFVFQASTLLQNNIKADPVNLTIFRSLDKEVQKRVLDAANSMTTISNVVLCVITSLGIGSDANPGNLPSKIGETKYPEFMKRYDDIIEKGTVEELESFFEEMNEMSVTDIEDPVEMAFFGTVQSEPVIIGNGSYEQLLNKKRENLTKFKEPPKVWSERINTQKLTTKTVEKVKADNSGYLKEEDNQEIFKTNEAATNNIKTIEANEGIASKYKLFCSQAKTSLPNIYSKAQEAYKLYTSAINSNSYSENELKLLKDNYESEKRMLDSVAKGLSEVAKFGLTEFNDVTGEDLTETMERQNNGN